VKKDAQHLAFFFVAAEVTRLSLFGLTLDTWHSALRQSLIIGVLPSQNDGRARHSVRAVSRDSPQYADFLGNAAARTE